MFAHENAEQSLVYMFMLINSFTKKACDKSGPQMATLLHMCSGSTQGIRCKCHMSNQEMTGKLLRNLAFSSQLLDVQLLSTSSALPQLCRVYP